MSGIEDQISEWKSAVLKHRAVSSEDVEELEGHLRDQIAELTSGGPGSSGQGSSGLTEEEAFLIAVRRIGATDKVTAEFARVHSNRLWKQLTAIQAEPASTPKLVWMVVFALAAAIAMQIGRLFWTADTGSGGMWSSGIGSSGTWFLRSYGLFLFLPLVAWFVFLKKPGRKLTIILAAVSVGLIAAAWLFPFTSQSPALDGTFSASEIVFALHLPILLWLVAGIAFLARQWRSQERRMDFYRFSGEWLIYYTLIAIGGYILMMLTAAILMPFSWQVTYEVYFWLIPSGMAGAVIVAAWLVEAKQSIIENLAPVLAAIFTPLFALLISASAVLYLATRVWVNFNRELLLSFDALLLVVVALVVYGISARESTRPVGANDWIRFVAVLSAIVLDGLVLASMIGRIGEYGLTPNRVAALGLNLILLLNLLGTVWFSLRHLTGRATIGGLERWQTGYLPVYFAWLAFVVLLLPALFGFA